MIKLTSLNSNITAIIIGNGVEKNYEEYLKWTKTSAEKGNYAAQYNLCMTLSNHKKFIVEKGSIAINGISLTIANIKEDVFDVSIIPHTYSCTNLSNLNEGDIVNIEFDALAKYIHLNDEW